MRRISLATLAFAVVVIVWALSGIPMGPSIQSGPAILGIVYGIYIFYSLERIKQEEREAEAIELLKKQASEPAGANLE